MSLWGPIGDGGQQCDRRGVGWALRRGSLEVSGIRSGQPFDVARLKEYRLRVLDGTMEILRAEEPFDSGPFLLESFEPPLSIRMIGSEVIFERFAAHGTFDQTAERLTDESPSVGRLRPFIFI